MRGPLARRHLTHVALRLIAATVLLAAVVTGHLRAPDPAGNIAYYLLIAGAYGMSVTVLVSLRAIAQRPWLTELYFAVDVLLVSVWVALTGGISSLFTSLYVLPIVAASSVSFRRGAFQAAMLGAVGYASLVLAQYLHLTGPASGALAAALAGPLPPVGVAVSTVALNVLGLLAVAYLSGSLAERARRADVRLERASEEIADLQFFNQYVIDNLVSGLATADEQQRLLTFNRSAAGITGLDQSVVVGRSALDVLQLPTGLTAGLADELRTIRSKRTDIHYRRHDGASITVGLAVAALPLPDGGRGYLYTFQDVTDAKSLEREAQLQKRLAAVGEMAAGIAHEIRNPLASMSGSMQILRQELRLSEDQSQLMDIVLRESERLNEIIRSFLAYARPQHVAVQPLDLCRVLQDTATLLRNSDAHAVDVQTPDTEVIVDGDENQVRQIVWNLATNGLRAMPDGGRLLLTAGYDAQRRDTAVLTVTDQGVGIAPEDLDGIFQPFRSSFGKGTGLGLAIVHRILSDYGAAIAVHSELEKGTTFRVTFPPASAANAQSARTPDSLRDEFHVAVRTRISPSRAGLELS